MTLTASLSGAALSAFSPTPFQSLPLSPSISLSQRSTTSNSIFKHHQEVDINKPLKPLTNLSFGANLFNSPHDLKARLSPCTPSSELHPLRRSYHHPYSLTPSSSLPDHNPAPSLPIQSTRSGHIPRRLGPASPMRRYIWYRRRAD